VGGKRMALKVGLLLSGSWNLLKGQYYSHFTQEQQPTHPQYTQSPKNTHPQTHNTQLHE
jgi:hypothetical protein